MSTVWAAPLSSQACCGSFMGLVAVSLIQSFLVLLMASASTTSGWQQSPDVPTLPCKALLPSVCFLTALLLISSSAPKSRSAGWDEQGSSIQLLHPLVICFFLQASVTSFQPPPPQPVVPLLWGVTISVTHRARVLTWCVGICSSV